MFSDQKFRFNLWLLGSVVTIGSFLIMQLVTLTGRWRYHMLSDQWQSLAVVGGLWALCAALWMAYPTTVGADGVRAADGIGRIHQVRWEEITAVSGLMGYFWVRHGKTGKALCIPMFQEDRAGFKESVLRHAPEGNPLRMYLTRS